ncbi:MAG: DUF4350 domain-containing protein [Bacteroidota bacterium]
MNNKRIFLYVGVVIVLLTAAFALLMQGSGHNWRETYADNLEDKKKDPYGVFVLRNLLKDYFPNEDFVVLKDSVHLQLDTAASGNYVFLGGGMYLDSLGSNALLDFVDRGNTALVLTRSIDYELSSLFFDQTCDTNYYWYDYYHSQNDTLVEVNFIHPNLRRDRAYRFQHLKKKSKVEERDWYYFNEDYFCEEAVYPITPLGTYNEVQTNFIRIPYGDGFFYLHSMPSLFTNIHLLEEEGLSYTEKVCSHLKEGTIYWDVKSKIPTRIAEQMNYNYNRGLSTEHPLKYILSQAPLAWAWYILLTMGLLYLVFRAKRRQRMIPVTEKNENTSLAFISTIGRMYFLQNNHRHLLLQKMQLFLGEVRDRYKINTQELDEPFVQKLATRSKVDVRIINKIILMHQNVQKSTTGASDNTLIEFHQEMERFWEQSR